MTTTTGSSNATRTQKTIRKSGRRIWFSFVLLVFLVSQLGVPTTPVKAATTITFSGQELLGRPTDSSITINIVSDQTIEYYYEYGTSPGSYSMETSIMTAAGGQPHEAVITGLSPNTRYYYRMRYHLPGETDWVSRPEHSFWTQRAQGSTFKFTVTSDSHVNIMLGNANTWRQTVNNIATDQPDFEIDLGDTFAMDSITTAAGADQAYLYQRQFFDVFGHSAATFLALGNHEQEEGWHLDDTGDPATSQPVLGANARKKYFLNPVPDGFYDGNTDTHPDLDGDGLREDYYAWTWGDALFVVIDPFWYTITKPFTGNTGGGEASDPGSGDRWDWTLGEQQFNWLNQTLENSTASYKFIFAHHYVGGSDDYVRKGAMAAHIGEWGGYNEDGSTWGWDVRRLGWGSDPVHQILVANGVSAFFHGHDHQYAYEVRDGIVYQALPSAGFSGNGFGLYSESDPYTERVLPSPGHLRVTVSPSEALVEYVSSTNGVVNHSYTIAPNSSAPDSDEITYLGEVGSAAANAAGTSLAIPVGPAGVAAGNTVIVGFASRGDPNYAEPVVTDSRGNTYNLANYAVTYQHGRAYLFYSYIEEALAEGDQITITTSSVQSRVAVAAAFGGLLAEGVLDQTLANPTGTTTTMQGNNPTVGPTDQTAQANELIIGLVGTEEATDAGAGTWLNDFVAGPQRKTSGASYEWRVSMGYQIASAPGQFTAAKTVANNPYWAAVIATFKGSVTAPYVPEHSLLLGRPTDDSVTVNAVLNDNGRVYFEYGTEPGVYTAQTDMLTAAAGEPVEGVIAGLDPNTRYYYRMRYQAAGQTWWAEGEEHSFHTQRAKGESFTFTLTSDSHLGDTFSGNSPARYEQATLNIAADRPDFHLDLGDAFIVNEVDDQSDADAIYLAQRPYFGNYSHSSPVFLAIGNHENEEGWNLDDTPVSKALLSINARKKFFLNPIPDDFYTGNEDRLPQIAGDQLREDYYAWEWGDALFIVLDPFQYTMTKPYGTIVGSGEDDDEVVSGDQWNWTLGREQYEWFKEMLQNSSARYKFVFSHHVVGGQLNVSGPAGLPAYVRGGGLAAPYFEWGGKNADGTWGFNSRRSGWGDESVHQLMVKHGVTAYFHGHDHQFVHEVVDGIVYQLVPSPAMTGNGFDLYGSSPYVVSGGNLPNAGHLRVTVAQDQVTVEYVRSAISGDGVANGEISYAYTIEAGIPTCYALSLNHTGQGSDPVASPSRSTACAAEGQYVPGEAITLSGAVPAEGWQITGWTGTANDNSTAGTNTLTMPASDHTVSVHYADLTPPETTITAHPDDPSSSAEASFEFSSSEAGSTFECRLDDENFAACTSPKTYSGLADGRHNFAVRATDPQGNTDPTPAVYTWVVEAVNDPPVIAGGDTVQVEMSEDGEPVAFSLTLNATDVDGDTLTWSIATQASHGIAGVSGTGTSRAISYTPETDFFGSDSFVVQVSDGQGGTDTITVNVTIQPVNDPPVANAQSVTTTEDSAKEITLTGSDVEGSPLTYSIVSGPSHGSLTGSAPNLIYTPDANYHGPDSFTFRVSDGTANSADAVVSITVTPVNDAPVAVVDTGYVVEQDGELIVPATAGVLANDSDVDGDALSAILVSPPANGELTLNSDGSFTYTPEPGFVGLITFTYRAFDGLEYSPETRVEIAVIGAPGGGQLQIYLPIVTWGS